MKITRIHQIELTSHCNLRCQYCVHPKMTRKKMDMPIDVFQQALDQIQYCVESYNQTELNLAGIGESTMHPDFITLVALVRERLGDNIQLSLATNGVSMTPAIAEALKKYNVFTWVSLHRPEKAGLAIELLRDSPILKGISADPSIAAMDWAGQETIAKWFVSTNVNEICPWLDQGMVMVTADGSLTTCCLDGNGVGIVGTVWNDLDDLEVKPYSLCSKCHLKIPEHNPVIVKQDDIIREQYL